jgi:hypothetical protein
LTLFTYQSAFKEFLWLKKRTNALAAESNANGVDSYRVDVDSEFDDYGVDEDSISKAMKIVLAKIGFMKINAPSIILRELRAKSNSKSSSSSSSSGSDNNSNNNRISKESVSTTFVMRDGELTSDYEPIMKGQRVNDGKLSNEEAWTYHNKLMTRQYYGKTPPKKPEPF